MYVTFAPPLTLPLDVRDHRSTLNFTVGCTWPSPFFLSLSCQHFIVVIVIIDIVAVAIDTLFVVIIIIIVIDIPFFLISVIPTSY